VAEKTIEWAYGPTEDDLADATKALTLVGVREVTLDPEQVVYPAKDLLRFSLLPGLPLTNKGVDKWFQRLTAGRNEIPPVLLVRGDLTIDRPLIIAEGYHRVSAAYLCGEQTEVVGYFLNWV